MQFLESSSTPLQSLPPLRGAGAAHSRLRQWVHSVLQADHLLHSVHAPSTAGHQTQTPGWGRFGTAPPGWGTSVSSRGKVPAPEPLSLGSGSTGGPWKPGVGPRVSEVPLTWAEGGAGYFLEGLPVAEGAAVERCGVGARPRALLPAPAAAVVARRPLGPGGPAPVHCRRRGTRQHPKPQRPRRQSPAGKVQTELKEWFTPTPGRKHGPFPMARVGTVDNDSGRGAPALGHDVLGHAGVIGSVQEAGLLDDEVVIDGDEEVGVLGGIDDVLVPQPLHLARGKGRMGGGRGGGR